MGEENQLQTSPTIYTGEGIRDRMASISKHRESLKLLKAKQTQSSLDSDSNALFEQSLNVNNKELSSRYNQASQSAAAASMIKSYAERNGDDWSDLNTPQEILTEYFNLNPDDETFNRIMNFTKSSQDPEEFGLEMGWIKKDGWDKLWDFTKNAANNFLSFFESGGDAVRNADNRMLGAIEGDQTPGALENYARMNYGKDFYSLSEAEKTEARQAVSTKEGLDMYKPTLQRIGLKGAEAGADALFTVVAPWMKAGFSVAGAGADADVPYVSDFLGWVLGGLDKVNGFIGGVVTEVPGLSNFRNSLQTEQEQEKFDNFIGMIVLGKILQKRGGRLKNSRSLKDAVIQEIDPVTTIKEFQRMATEAPSDIQKGISWLKDGRATEAPSDIQKGISWLKDGRATEENLQETAGKIVKSKTMEETETATRALKDADVAGSKSYKELDERLSNRGREIEAAEDVEYAKTDDIRFKPEETRSIKEYEKDGYTTTKELRPVEEGIELLKDFYEGNPDKMAQIELLEQKFNNEGLNRREINNISRAIAQEFETYKARGQEKTSIKAKDVESIRRAVKDFAREGNETLVELDKQWSDNMNTRAMIKDVQNEIVRAKNNLANKNILQKTAGTIGQVFNMLGGTEALSRAGLKWLVGNDGLDPITRQNKLRSNLGRFKRLNERLNAAESKTEAKAIVKEFNEEFEKANGPIEGEVMETKANNGYDNVYSQDKVQLSPK